MMQNSIFDKMGKAKTKRKKQERRIKEFRTHTDPAHLNPCSPAIQMQIKRMRKKHIPLTATQKVIEAKRMEIAKRLYPEVAQGDPYHLTVNQLATIEKELQEWLTQIQDDAM